MTSLSAISTTAIKDGHTGTHGPAHRHHHHSASNASGSSTNTLDAERADRISRLAGLERVSTVRQPNSISQSSYTSPAPFVSSSANPSGLPGPPPAQNQTIGYFDANGNPRLIPARSTVGSASATGSMAGRTTWASGSGSTTTENMDQDHEQDQEQEVDEGRSMSHMSMQDTSMSMAGDDPDKMSDVDAVSSAGLSDGGQESLVGFGEGANSTVSGPISAPRDPLQMARLRAAARAAGSNAVMAQGTAGMERTGSAQPGFAGQSQLTPGGVSDGSAMEGIETAERIVRERIGPTEGGIHSPTDSSRLGKFPFEER